MPERRDPGPAGPEDVLDAVVLGAGSGGLTVAVGLAGLGRRVALVERGPVGGDCTNVGCIPSKTLLHLVAATPRALAPEEVLARVRAARDRLREEETRWVEGLAGVAFVRGEARLLDARTVAVAGPAGERRLRAARIVIATGSRPAPLAIAGLPPERTLTNEGLFELEAPPAHLAIVGAGAVGAEMAFAFRRLGSRVTLVEAAGRVLPGLEPEAGARIRARLEAEGVTVVPDATAARFEPAGCTLVLDEGGAERRVEGVDRVLLAVGRRPNLPAGLDAAGVRHDARGVPADSVGRTNVRSVLAVGDVVPGSRTTHEANARGRRAVRAIAFPWLPAGRAPVVPSAVFTDPEVAQVGPPLAELRRRLHPDAIWTRRVELGDTDRGYTMGLAGGTPSSASPDGAGPAEPASGFVLIHARRLSGRLLSATVVAPAASEMVPLLTLALARGVRLYALSDLVFPYPTLAEAVKKAADAFVFATLPRLPRELALYLRTRWARPPIRPEDAAG